MAVVENSIRVYWSDDEEIPFGQLANYDIIRDEMTIRGISWTQVILINGFFIRAHLTRSDLAIYWRKFSQNFIGKLFRVRRSQLLTTFNYFHWEDIFREKFSKVFFSFKDRTFTSSRVFDRVIAIYWKVVKNVSLYHCQYYRRRRKMKEKSIKTLIDINSTYRENFIQRRCWIFISVITRSPTHAFA